MFHTISDPITWSLSRKRWFCSKKGKFLRSEIHKDITMGNLQLQNHFFGTYLWGVRLCKFKDMYQKAMKGVIGTHFKFKELYPWPNHSSNISIKKVIGNDMERLKVESKWQNFHVFCHFFFIKWLQMYKKM